MLLIAHFGPRQSDVFIPAMIALVVAAAPIAGLLVVAPALRGARGVLVKAVAALVIAVGVIGAVLAAVPAQQTLSAQVPALQTAIAAQYGLHVSASTAGRLIDGDTIKDTPADPHALKAFGSTDPVHLVGKGDHHYVLVRSESAAKTTTVFPAR